MLILSNKTKIELSDKLGQGGEGEVFKIKSPYRHHSNVAKIFYDNKRTPEQEQKLKYLIANPPQIEENGHTFLIWPLDILYENGKFVGFIMPNAEGIELELLCDDAFLNYPEYKGTTWKKFAFSQPNSLITRLKIAHNVCAAVAAVHAKKEYVLADLKPVNIKITDSGLISIIDLDSIQVAKNGKILFASKVATPEYSPPEVNKKSSMKNEYWDRFSLAVVVYRILVGIHPFSGSLNPPHDKITVYEDLIKHGFYPHGKHKGKFAVINDAHNKLMNYPDAIIDIFKNVFDDYIFHPDKRPSAVDWCNALTAKPEILNFEADKSFVLPNAPVRLKWKVVNATKITINNGIGDVTNKNVIDWNVATPSTFILEATNPFGTVHSDPIDVATFNLRVPNTIFIPTPDINLHASISMPNSLNQIPSPSFPAIITPSINVNTDLAKKINGNFKLTIAAKTKLSERLKNNYKWTKNILENSNYHLSFDDYILYKIHDWVLKVRGFYNDLIKKNK